MRKIYALRQYLGLKKIFVLGHSYGGMKAQYYLAHYPEHVYGAIIIDSGTNADVLEGNRVANHIKETGTEKQYHIWISNALQTGELTVNEYLEKMGPLYFGKGKVDLVGFINRNLRCTTNDDVLMHQMAGELASIETFNLLPDLEKANVPCLILVGEQDFITDVDAAKELHQALQNSELHVIEGAGHYSFVDSGDKEFPIIQRFVEEHFSKS